ncbi:ComEC/Rec2 family competence protein [Bryocella elongata]|nr:MBL fold metallo-hydrolase [Bryocella elongata]
MFVLLSGCALAGTPRAKKGERFQVTCLEVADSGRGVGLAVILQTPGGHTYLYDTGVGYPTKDDPSGWVAGINTGRDQIAPFLRANGIEQIDGVVISHAHLDHWGGLLWLVDHFPVRKLYDSGYDFPGAMNPEWRQELGGYTDLRNRFIQRGAYQQVRAGDRLPWDPELEVEVLAPPRDHYFSEPRPELRSAADPPSHYLVNANSVELRIRYGNVVYLFPGDIQKDDVDHSLLTSVPHDKLKANILIAPAHGINANQSDAFAKAVSPQVVVASLFPRWLQDKLAPALYSDRGAKVYITGERGWVKIVSDGEHFTVYPERSGESHAVSVPGVPDHFSVTGK